MTAPDNQTILSSPATMEQALAGLPPSSASTWPVFWVASIAVFLVSMDGLVAARVLQAMGAALLTPASLSLVLAAFPTNKRAVAVSLWGAVGGLAAAVGPSLGAFVIASLGWQWALYLNVPLGMLAIWRGATLLTEARQPSTGRPLDLVGMGLLIVGIGALALASVAKKSEPVPAQTLRTT